MATPRGISETLESIALQDLDAGISLSVAWPGTMTASPKPAFVMPLRAAPRNVTIVDIAAHDDANIMRCEALPALAAVTPDQADWVWTLETGHRLYQRDSLTVLAKTIRQNAYFTSMRFMSVMPPGHSIRAICSTRPPMSFARPSDISRFSERSLR